MKELTTRNVFLLSLGCFLVISILTNANFSYYQVPMNKNLNDKNKTNLKIAGSWEIGPIEIDDNDPLKNWTMTAATYDWCSGNGTFSNPYVIENITINGVGSYYCISIVNSDAYFNINNCTLFNSGGESHSGGLNLGYANNGKITNNNCSFNMVGIYLNSSHNNVISGNIVSNNSFQGIYLYAQCNDNKIINNTINFNAVESNWGGIRIKNSYNNVIYNNNVSYNAGRGMDLVYIYNSEIVNNIANGNAEGIAVQASENISVSSNKVQGNRNGMFIYNDKNCNVFNNTAVLNEWTGLEIERVVNVTVAKNIVSYSQTGISLRGSNVYECYNNTVTANIVKNNYYGMYIRGVNNSKVIGNNITSNYYGIALGYTNRIIVSGNNLIGNDICIIEVDCEGNIIEDNYCDIEEPPNIPGYNLLLLIGAISVVSLIIVVIQKRIYFKEKIEV